MKLVGRRGLLLKARVSKVEKDAYAEKNVVVGSAAWLFAELKAWYAIEEPLLETRGIIDPAWTVVLADIESCKF